MHDSHGSEPTTAFDEDELKPTETAGYKSVHLNSRPYTRRFVNLGCWDAGSDKRRLWSSEWGLGFFQSRCGLHARRGACPLVTQNMKDGLRNLSVIRYRRSNIWFASLAGTTNWTQKMTRCSGGKPLWASEQLPMARVRAVLGRRRRARDRKLKCCR